MTVEIRDNDPKGILGGTQYYAEFKTSLMFSYNEEAREQALSDELRRIEAEYRKKFAYIDSNLVKS